MQIKNLIPKSKEVLLQPKSREGVFYDTFSYIIQSPAKNGNSNGSTPLAPSDKKYLYIVSQIQSNDPSLDYVPNLIATFIKRELESGNGSIQLTTSGSSEKNDIFKISLKKTNELIEGLFKNNSDIKINLGIVLINKDKVSASKIGKAKLFIYRPQKPALVKALADREETFDIFENISQFSRFHIDNKRFSSIISGEVKKSDRFFFFIPDLRLSLKQKLIISSLSKNNQDSFLDDFHKIVSPEGKQNKTPINCCGIHFEIEEEITNLSDSANSKPKTEKETPITATEVAKINKNDTLKRTVDKFKEMVIGENSNSHHRWRLIKNRGMSNHFIFGLIAFLILAGLIFFTRGNSKLKEEVSSINEKIRISESRLLLKQNYEARKYLSEAVKELDILEKSNQKNEILLAAVSLLNRIEKVDSTTKLNPLIDLSSIADIDAGKFKSVLASNGKVFIDNSEKIYQIEENGLKTIEESGNIILTWIKENKLITYGTNIKIIDLGNNKISELRKKFSFEPIEVKNYEDNLYFLGSKNIYKISNALVKPAEELEWLKSTEAEKIPGNFIAFDLDSTIYTITTEKKLAALFKGELTKLTDLDFDIKPGTELFNIGGEKILVVDKEMKLARVIDDTGDLKVSYDLSEAETIKDVYFDKAVSTLYILSPAKIWNLKI
ncbi:MAG: hypothetical protein A2734_00390 [Parcubacteria group bacterium RIFCSPHIGHO2_01_FULL_40_30]|nr:MAG: hypothetical protein A2734_00390 [Parcubacteria group bacterium RIFCSPHIGHO2_01_FULL_40_30]OHB18777.1 MAG: hypothetical protein A3D40_00160 [Parcubacteria group bacterium RIFCSPHIGHO2_02_FULL_40_12]OHB23982.1 MAG: hypothetical protein A3F96_00360 [Parcubacteria group bacterium RIFCSPLOWO2_12_FULL_40_10]